MKETKPNLLITILKASRLKQWIKNCLVLVAPLAAGRLPNEANRILILDSAVITRVLISFIAFGFAASSIYLINDILDIDADRKHPEKQYRPIAAGALSIPLAYVISGLYMVVAVLLALQVNRNLGLVILVYLVVQLGYCFGLKHQAVMDICIVSSGFLLRGIAGGVAAELVLSQWFLLVMIFGSLFMVAGKRYAELKLVHTTGTKIRKALENYTETYIRFVWTLSATVVVICYALWAFNQDLIVGGNIWYEISMAPFIIAILRYAIDVDRGTAGSPEQIAFQDRILQILAIFWIIIVFIAVYIA